MPIDKKTKKVFKKYDKVTNMTLFELQGWATNPCSKKASLTTDPLDRNIRLKSKKRSNWSEKDVKDARRTINFIKRMKNTPAGDEVEGCGVSKRTIALKNWGFDPNK